MGKRPPAFTPLYRVWRAEDEEEESGRDYGALTVSDAARLYADFFHRHRDGWECTWPLVFLVRALETNMLYAVSVSREMVPEFYADEGLSFADFAPAHHLVYGMEAMCGDPRLAAPKESWPVGQSFVEVKALVALGESTLGPEITCKGCRKRGAPLFARLVEARAKLQERQG